MPTRVIVLRSRKTVLWGISHFWWPLCFALCVTPLIHIHRKLPEMFQMQYKIISFLVWRKVQRNKNVGKIKDIWGFCEARWTIMSWLYSGSFLNCMIAGFDVFSNIFPSFWIDFCLLKILPLTDKKWENNETGNHTIIDSLPSTSWS